MAIAKTTECLSVQIMFNKMNGTVQAYFQSADVIYDNGVVIAATPTGKTYSFNTVSTEPTEDIDTLEQAVAEVFARLYAESLPPAEPK